MNGIEHGGPDGGHDVVLDFSTNANPLGPPDAVLAAVGRANRQRYPDPAYANLRAQLAAWHGVDSQRVLPTAGTSEAIRRLTLAAFLQGHRTVWAPRPGYSDYAFAALALGMAVRDYDDAETMLAEMGTDTRQSALVWLCEPNNPTGQSLPASFWAAFMGAPPQTPPATPTAARGASRHIWALDRAYEPLRLSGHDAVPKAAANQMWQCLSPNKALGMTGVRAGYLLAPSRAAWEPLRQAPFGAVSSCHQSLLQLAPSWVLSAEGVAFLGAWIEPEVQDWLARCRTTLSLWAQQQRHALNGLDWLQEPATVPFWLARPPEQGLVLAQHLAHLRQQGIKLRDATSLGKPGWVRISAQAPEARRALVSAWQRAAKVRA